MKICSRCYKELDPANTDYIASATGNMIPFCPECAAIILEEYRQELIESEKDNEWPTSPTATN